MSANDDKNYWWIRLTDDFFKRHDIRVIKKMQNGHKYVVVYLELLTESISHEGRLRFSDTIPYDINMLATILDEDVDTIRSALDVLVKLNLVEILDDQTYYMHQVAKMYGKEKGQTRRKRIARDNKAQISCDEPKEIETLENKYDIANRLKGLFGDDVNIDKALDLCEQLYIHNITHNNFYRVYEIMGDSSIHNKKQYCKTFLGGGK